jgi:hypothetical protein
LVRGHESGLVVRDIAARIGHALLWIVACGGAVLAITGTGWIGAKPIWLGGDAVRIGCLAAAVASWAVLDAWSWRAADGVRWVTRTAVAPIAVLAMVPFLYPTAMLDAAKHPWDFLAKHRDELRAADVLVVAGGSPALATSWATGRRDLVIAGWADEFDNELDLPDERPRRIGWDEVGDRVSGSTGATPPRSVAVLCLTATADRVRRSSHLPPPTVDDADRDLTLLIWR